MRNTLQPQSPGRTTLTICAVLASLMLLISCDNDDSPSGPEDPVSPGTLNDWVAFDENVYFATNMVGLEEPFIDGDYVLGEPYTDVNANGVYDPGIDIFIKSNDASINQDLNHNGQYDGPESAWESGIPFDDLNRNGVYDYPNGAFDTGEPFLDLNSSGDWDYGGQRYIIRWIPFDTVANTVRWCFEYSDSIASFTSNAGREYWLPKRTTSTWDYDNDRPKRDTSWIFETSDSGLVLHSTLWETRLPVLPMGNVTLNSHRVVIPYGGNGDSASMLRTVAMDEPFVFVGDTIANVLCVRFGDAWVGTDSTTVDSSYTWEFFFARHHGIVGIRDPQLSRAFPYKLDSVPMPFSQ